jgi:superfamily II DNA/RNA helicase
MTEPDLAAGFQHTQFLVMDEADRLLEVSFEPDLRAILSKLPAKHQTLLFSATMTKNLVALQKAVLRDAYHFQVLLGSCLSSTSHHTLSQSRQAGCFCSAVLILCSAYVMLLSAAAPHLQNKSS